VPARPGAAGAHSTPAQVVHGTPQSPELPSSIAQYVAAILGLTNYSPFVSQDAHVNTHLLHPQSRSSNYCVAISGIAGDCRLPSDFASSYGLSSLTASGAEGQGQTVGVVALATVDPGAPQYFWRNVMHLAPSGRTLTAVDVDGGAGAPSYTAGSDEADLDTEQAGGVAPDSNVIIYQAPNTDFGFADAFFDAASQNTVSAVSTSWGDSDTFTDAAIAAGAESPGYVTAIDEALLELAVQGQSAFAAAGDNGAYDASADLGTTNLSTDYPADSPYITSGGGTTLPWSGTLVGPTNITASVSVTAQRTWGWDYLWPAIATVLAEPLATAAEGAVVGGGGGFSTSEPQPSYQQGFPGTTSFDAVPYLRPTDYTDVGGGVVEPTEWNFDPFPPLIHGVGSGRAVPDLSVDADPYSGYLVYCPSCVAAGYTELVPGYGGTSFVGPQLVGSTAVIDSYLGRRVGLWSPSLYSFASGAQSPFTPLQSAGTANDNIFYTGSPGLPYNPASGLGIPNLGTLASDFAAAG
jgi:kumamolisin